MPTFLGAMAIFYRDGDSFPALPGAPYSNVISYAMVYLIGGLVHSAGLDRFAGGKKGKKRE